MVQVSGTCNLVIAAYRPLLALRYFLESERRSSTMGGTCHWLAYAGLLNPHLPVAVLHMINDILPCPMIIIVIKIETMTDILTALIGVGGVAIGGLITWVMNRRSDLTSAYQSLVSAQGEMRRQIDAQDQKINALIKHRDALQYTIDLETGYIRALGHWLSKFCEIIEPEFLENHPKPSLPDDLRDRIASLEELAGDND